MTTAEWKAFEKECVEYLNKAYTPTKQCTFTLNGGSDSTASDIVVKTKSGNTFNIEAKMPAAQAGQFVLFPNEKERIFEYSDRNRSPKNSIAEKIVECMTSDYNTYCNPKTKGIELDLPVSLMFDWVKDYYSTVKQTRYFITQYDNEFVIMPVEKIDKYFDISGTYRVKKSGSCCPSPNNVQEIEQILKEEGLESGTPLFKDDECQVFIQSNCPDTFMLAGTSYRYKFNNIKGNIYGIRRLSNTANANVIFSLTAKTPQQKADLEQFENDLL